MALQVILGYGAKLLGGLLLDFRGLHLRLLQSFVAGHVQLASGLTTLEVCGGSLFCYMGTCCSPLFSLGLSFEKPSAAAVEFLSSQNRLSFRLVSHLSCQKSTEVVPLFPLVVVLSALNQAVRCARGSNQGGRCLTERVQTMFGQMVHWEWVSVASWATQIFEMDSDGCPVLSEKMSARNKTYLFDPFCYTLTINDCRNITHYNSN